MPKHIMRWLVQIAVVWATPDHGIITKGVKSPGNNQSAFPEMPFGSGWIQSECLFQRSRCCCRIVQ